MVARDGERAHERAGKAYCILRCRRVRGSRLRTRQRWRPVWQQASCLRRCTGHRGRSLHRRLPHPRWRHWELELVAAGRAAEQSMLTSPPSRSSLSTPGVRTAQQQCGKSSESISLLARAISVEICAQVAPRWGFWSAYSACPHRQRHHVASRTDLLCASPVLPASLVQAMVAPVTTPRSAARRSSTRVSGLRRVESTQSRRSNATRWMPRRTTAWWRVRLHWASRHATAVIGRTILMQSHCDLEHRPVRRPAHTPADARYIWWRGEEGTSQASWLPHGSWGGAHTFQCARAHAMQHICAS